MKGKPGAQSPPGPRSGGATYIRWSRTTCPNVTEAELIYAGRAAGIQFTQKGGTNNYLCLPDEPQYLEYGAGIQGYSPLHGTKYQIGGIASHCVVYMTTSLSLLNTSISHHDSWSIVASQHLDSGVQRLFDEQTL